MNRSDEEQDQIYLKFFRAKLDNLKNEKNKLQNLTQGEMTRLELQAEDTDNTVMFTQKISDLRSYLDPKAAFSP